ncbi:hypothetical protein WR25_17954 [Diploscapter pachys]|uniref:Uncharacterized protein n=1 Tax=Diploscapter pachys TaxID=2018661 RepID=A0A2A2LCU4_9BILA|nr:hypothetical protein WR25_17954 [Diploscapter pachys]
MEVDPAQPSTPARSPSVQPLFDFTRPHVAFDTQVLIADRQQKGSADLTASLLVRVFNIGTGSYEVSRKTLTRRRDYALARYRSFFFFFFLNLNVGA